MRIFVLCLSLLVTSNLYAAECDTSAMVDNCSVTPTAAKFTFLAIGLCSGPPVLPAIGRAFNYDNCTLIYDKLNQDGQVIEWIGNGDYGNLVNDLIIPPNGTYDYFVWGIVNEMSVKLAMEFGSSTKTLGDNAVQTAGTYCRTVNGVRYGSEGNRYETAECASTYVEPEYSTWDLFATGGIDTSRPYNGNYDSYYIKSDLTLATSFSDAIAVIAVHQPTNPIVISDTTTELIFDWDFDELVRIDIETGSDIDGWFLPMFGYPALSISTN